MHFQLTACFEHLTSQEEAYLLKQYRAGEMEFLKADDAPKFSEKTRIDLSTIKKAEDLTLSESDLKFKPLAD